MPAKRDKKKADKRAREEDSDDEVMVDVEAIKLHEAVEKVLDGKLTEIAAGIRLSITSDLNRKLESMTKTFTEANVNAQRAFDAKFEAFEKMMTQLAAKGTTKDAGGESKEARRQWVADMEKGSQCKADRNGEYFLFPTFVKAGGDAKRTSQFNSRLLKIEMNPKCKDANYIANLRSDGEEVLETLEEHEEVFSRLTVMKLSEINQELYDAAKSTLLKAVSVMVRLDCDYAACGKKLETLAFKESIAASADSHLHWNSQTASMTIYDNTKKSWMAEKKKGDGEKKH